MTTRTSALLGRPALEVLEPRLLLDADVIVSEIMYHPPDPAQPTAYTALDFEYIELFNRGDESAEVGGWRFVDGISLTLSERTVAPDGYLVVAANLAAFTEKYPTVTNVVSGPDGRWDGRLSNSGEEIDLVDLNGLRVDRVTYADEGDWSVRVEGPDDPYYSYNGWDWSDAHDGGGKSLEFINAALSNNDGQNWSVSLVDGGTPGQPNSVAADDTAPLILNVEHSPAIPQPGQPVTVTAEIVDELPAGVTVTLWYRRDGDATFQPLEMRDDGASGDDHAHDGVYGAAIESDPDVWGDDTIVEFYVEAADAGANSRTWPAPVAEWGQVANALYQYDADFDPAAEWEPGTHPLYRLILTEVERAHLRYIGTHATASDSDAQMNATLIGTGGVDTDVRYLAGVRNRGHGSRDNQPNNYRVNLAQDRPWQDVTALNVNGQFTWVQLAGSAIFQRSGLPVGDARPARVLVNGQDLSLEDGSYLTYGSYVHVEVIDGDFADSHFPGDGGGNVYKCMRVGEQADLRYEGTDPSEYSHNYLKETNLDEYDFSDLIELTDVLNNTPDELYEQEVNRVLNVDELLRYFAVNTLLDNSETTLSNGNGDDYYLYRGVEDPRFVVIQHDLDSLFGEGDNPGTVTAGIFEMDAIAAMDRFIHYRPFTERYYGHLLELIETAFSPEQMNPFLDNLLAGWAGPAQIQDMKDFVAARNAHVLGIIRGDLTVTTDAPVVSGYPLTNTPQVDVHGTYDPAVTRSILVNGRRAERTPETGQWFFDETISDFASRTLVFADSPVKFHVPAAGDDLAAWTARGFDDSSWIDSFTVGAAGMLLTEVATGETTFVEIENVSGAAIDTTGWSVLVNNAVDGLNVVNPVAWALPASIASEEVLYRTGDSGDARYWGGPIDWQPEGPGWVMVLDAAGSVMDFVAWGYSDVEIASLSVDYGAFTGITVGGQWSGAGAEPGSLEGMPTAGFVAFNDHIQGDTHPNATLYSARTGDTAGGFLKDIGTGDDTSATLTVSQSGVRFASNQGEPQPETDAYEIFDGYVDFGSATDSSIEVAGNDTYTHAFTGLDTGDVVTYNFAGTAVRGRSDYTDRWTLVTLVGAESYTADHSDGIGVVVVSDTEVAIWTGHNSGADQGFVAAWTEIDPGPDGALSIVSSQYTGETPGVGTGTASGGDKGYGITGIRLEEVAPSGPTHWLRRAASTDNDGAGDFVRGTAPSMGVQNPELTVPFGTVVPVTMALGFSDDQPEFEALIATHVGEAMLHVNPSIWTRAEFQAIDPAAWETMALRVRYDDGFVAYLNGTEIARRNADNPPAYDVAASDEHPNAQAVVFEDIDVSGHLGELQPGANVLAIHGLNLGVDDGDFLLQAELSVTRGDPQTGLSLYPGINRILVQALDAEGAELDRQTIDLWYDPDAQVEDPRLSGTLTQDRTLTPAGGPYTVIGDVTVPDGVTLTIEPGTTVNLQGGLDLTVQSGGRLVAQGTDSQHITFQREPGQSGAWGRVTFSGTREDNVLAYVDMDGPSSRAVDVNGAELLMDHVVWTGTTSSCLEIHNPYLLVRGCVFPSIDGGETVHGGGLSGDQYLIFEGNTFGTTTGYSDVIDFTGGQRPGPIMQFYGNTFLGGSDDALDLDGTDAHIEGNVFMHFHKGHTGASTCNAVATGRSGHSSHIVLVGNLFYDNDHDVLLKEGCTLHAENNVFVGSGEASINFGERERGTTPGGGVYLDGNIWWNNPALFQNYFDPDADYGPTGDVILNHSIAPAAWHGFGEGNLDADPLFVDDAGDFHLQAGSPAIGTGPNGLDMGAYVPPWASVSGEPEGTTTETTATLLVGGGHVYAYKYRLQQDGAWGPWSAEVARALPVQPSGLVQPIDPVELTLADGHTYTVEVIGRNTAGVWQGEAEATASATWTVDTSYVPPAGGEAPADPAGGTQSDEGGSPQPPEDVPAGTITVDTTWSPESGPYHLTGDVTVGDGVTLTILPGTSVFFDAGVGLTVNGRLLANGAEYEHIRFTATPGSGSWKGIDFVDSDGQNQIAYADIEYSDSSGASIYSDNAELKLDHVVWGHHDAMYLDLHDSSVILTNSVLPTISGGELFHHWGLPADGYALIQGNVFGATSGYNDIIDFTGGQRPGAIARFLDNVFLGGSDDGIDLDAADAHVEGNVFMHIHSDDPGRESKSYAVTTGTEYGHVSNLTVVGNLFYDVDHALLSKDGGFITAVNNTVVHATIAVIGFFEDRAGQWPGLGAYFDGNIFYDVADLFEDLDSLGTTTLLTVENTILPAELPWPGEGISYDDPRLLNTIGVTDPLREFRLRPGSPAIGTGPNGRDMGGAIVPGAAISGEPADVTRQTGATLSVGGPDIYGYKYRLQHNGEWLGPWSDPIERDTTTARLAVTSLTRTGDVATATVPGHGFAEGDVLNVLGAGQREYNGPFTIFNVTADTFDYAVVDTPATPATGTITCWLAPPEPAPLPPIPLADLDDGTYTVYVVAEDSAGFWQDEGDAAASRSWTVDTSHAQVRINELLALNRTAHEHEGTWPDLVELYNDSPVPLDLGGMSITDDPAHPNEFTFAPGTVIEADGYLLLYADDRDTPTSGIHLDFALSGEGEGVYLYDYDPVGHEYVLVDSVEFGLQLPDRSIGRVGPDGHWTLTQPTFDPVTGQENVPLRLGDPYGLRINEWFANGDVVVENDFVELYNPDTLPVDAGGLFLTDHPVAQPLKHEIPALSFLDAEGMGAFVADGDPDDGPDHTNFRLSAEQEMIGLFDADGRELDWVLYGPQTTDASQGRSPDGDATYEFYRLPTPGAMNAVGAGTETTSRTLVADGAAKRVLVPNAAVDPAWRQLVTFDDGGWTYWTPEPGQPGGVGYEDNTGYESYIGLDVIDAMNDQYTSCLVRIPFPLDVDPADVTELYLRMRYDDGFVAYLNGTPVAWEQFTGDPDWDDVADDNHEAGATWDTTNLSNYLFALEAGENLLAIHGLNVSAGSTDFLLCAELVATVTTTTGESPFESLYALFDGLRITELMYHPIGGEAGSGYSGTDFEFLELRNVGQEPLDLTGVRIRGGIEFTFPEATLLPGHYVVIVNNLSAFESRYGTGLPVAGEFTANLSNGGEDLVLQLPDPFDAAALRFEYDDDWHPVTDGDGPSLVIVDPLAHRRTWREGAAWEAGAAAGGSPGMPEPDAEYPVNAIVVNEVLAHSDGGVEDWIELHNTTDGEIDVGGWFLSDSSTNLQKFEIPPDTPIPGGGYVAFSEAADFGPLVSPTGFALSELSDEVFVSSGSGGALGNYRAYVVFGATANGMTLGRHTTSDGKVDFVAMSEPTWAGLNAEPLVGPVVFREIMYRPSGLPGDFQHEYLLLRNISDEAVALSDSAPQPNPWKFTRAITFEFPIGSELPAGGLAMVVPIDPAVFRTTYDIPAEVQLFGPYLLDLSNGGETVELSRPGTPEPDGTVPYIAVERVNYSDDPPWPQEPDGDGPALLRVADGVYGGEPTNWTITARPVLEGWMVDRMGGCLQPAVSLSFSREVLAGAGDYAVLDGAGQPLPPEQFAVSRPDERTMVVTFGSPLPYGGQYTVSVPGVTGPAGRRLDGRTEVPFTAALVGDADVDGTVGMLDYLAVKRGFGRNGPTWADGDFDGDGDVDFADYSAGRGNFGASYSAAEAEVLAPAPAAAQAAVPAGPPSPLAEPVIEADALAAPDGGASGGTQTDGAWAVEPAAPAAGDWLSGNAPAGDETVALDWHVPAVEATAEGAGEATDGQADLLDALKLAALPDPLVG